MKTGPNDPCWCDSARKYKKCHKAFDEAPDHQKYQEAQKAYAAIWRDTSERQFDRGDYDWMASQLSPFHIKRVFDVGCGSGHGLLALTRTLSPELRIVAVDENLACLTIAKETFSSSGQTAQLIARLETVSTPRGFVQIAESFSEPLPRPIALIEADLSTDQYLEKSLIEDGLFDAVTIWLTGAHMWRRTNVVSRSRGAESEHDLRILLQNDTYELADRILKPGGILQVVDRSEAPSSDFILNAYFEAHREQAEPTTLDVTKITYRIWEPPHGAGTKLITTVPEGRPSDLPQPQLAIVSILSVKM